MPSKNPQLLTRGVTPLAKNNLTPPQASIDWLQWSVEWPTSVGTFPSEPNAMKDLLRSALPPGGEVTLTDELIRPMAGYNSGMQASHARLFWHTENRNQHIGVLMTGQDLRNVILIPFPHEALIRWVVAKSRKISRLDFALDVFDTEANPSDLMEQWKSGKAATAARKVMEFTSYEKDTDGTPVASPTVYMGARESDRQLRIYDKAKQMGVNRQWTRIELQVRDARAWHLAEAMVRYGIARAGQQAVRDYFTVLEPSWWVDAVQGEATYIKPVGKPETNTEKWIREVCLPAIRREATKQIEDGSWRLYDALYGLLGDLLRDTDPNRRNGR